MNSSEDLYNQFDDSKMAQATGFSRPKPLEDTLKSNRVQIDLKTFVFALKQNSRGLFLRITEGVNGRQNTIIIPATGLEEFRNHLDDLLRIAKAALCNRAQE